MTWRCSPSSASTPAAALPLPFFVALAFAVWRGGQAAGGAWWVQRAFIISASQMVAQLLRVRSATVPSRKPQPSP